MAAARLTVRSIAEIMSDPNANSMRILQDQKYPKQEPQTFRQPYYQAAVTGVRRYYRAGNNPAVLAAAHNRALNINNKGRRANNVRVLEAFARSNLAARHFTWSPNAQSTATIERVTLRLSADMQATEDGKSRVLYFHCRGDPIDEPGAVLIAEVAHWVLQQNGIELRPSQIEIMDLSSGRSYRARAWRDQTIDALKARAITIASQWDNL